MQMAVDIYPRWSIADVALQLRPKYSPLHSHTDVEVIEEIAYIICLPRH